MCNLSSLVKSSRYFRTLSLPGSLNDWALWFFLRPDVKRKKEKISLLCTLKHFFQYKRHYHLLEGLTCGWILWNTWEGLSIFLLYDLIANKNATWMIKSVKAHKPCDKDAQSRFLSAFLYLPHSKFNFWKGAGMIRALRPSVAATPSESQHCTED